MFLGFVVPILSIWLVCSVLGCVFGLCGVYFCFFVGYVVVCVVFFVLI